MSPGTMRPRRRYASIVSSRHVRTVEFTTRLIRLRGGAGGPIRIADIERLSMVFET
jgi:hypothetical protein